jgi:DNA ligase (NAD+)
MNKDNIKIRIEKLKKEIEHHRYLYHVLDQQEISDAALDSLKKELVDLETQFPEFRTSDSPSLRVSGKALDKFQKIEHQYPVLSLQDIFSFPEFGDWEERNRKIFDTDYNYFCELKLDGLTVILTYEKGILKKAATRGNGKVGEDVINNIKTIESIPLKLRKGKYPIPDILTTRGEILLKKSVFEKMNKQREKDGLELYANPRNIAAGSIRQLNPKITAQRKLIHFVYDIKEDLGQKTHEEVHEMLKEFGFKVNPNNSFCQNHSDVEKYLNNWNEKRKKLDYLTDGVVIVVNDIKAEKKLGNIGKSERWMIAYKFPAEQVTSKVKDIVIQVGRTGALTPVAVLEPRLLAGSTVARATLHNFDEIERLGVKIGDTVIIEKAGDIIPAIVEVLPRLRNGNEKGIKIPQKCPVCSSDVCRQAGEVNHYCSNQNCSAVQKENIVHFVSKQAFNIEGLGHSIIEQLIVQGLLKNPADIFKLKKESLTPLERFADKSADNLIESIAQSKEVSLDRFIYALGIRHIGDETSILLANKFGTIEKLMNIKKEDLEHIHDIGPKVTESIYNYFQDKENVNYVKELLNLGIKVRVVKLKKQTLKAKIFVLTGGLESLTRDEAKKKLRDLGAKVSSSVSSKTDFVVSGENSGSKYDKAQKLGIQIINENTFLKMLD